MQPTVESKASSSEINIHRKLLDLKRAAIQESLEHNGQSIQTFQNPDGSELKVIANDGTYILAVVLPPNLSKTQQQ